MFVFPQVLRFSWAVAKIVTAKTGVSGDVVAAVTSPLEVFRR